MNIVILGTAHPYRGGLATFNERLAQQFQREGHTVRVMTFTLQYPSFLFPGKTQYTDAPAPEGLMIERVLHSCNPVNWIRLGRRLRHEAPDMLICCYWMAFMAPAFGTVCRLAKRNGHTRCISLVHNIFPHDKALLDRFVAPYYVGAQDGFVALSDSVVRDIETLSPLTPKMCSPHPIYDHYGALMTKDDACRALGLDADKDYMLFFGLVRAYKGLDLLLEAMSMLRERLPNLRLLVAGEFYEDEQKYRQLIDKLMIGDCVVVRNEFIPDDDLRKYFSASSLVAQPYRSATQSGVTQVAFHFEKPMLVTNVGGLGEIVHHGRMGYAVEVDSRAVAEAIADYYENRRQEDFTKYLQQQKSRYAWTNLVDAFVQTYEKTSK